MRVILCISDTQFPFHHKDTFAFLQALKSKYEPGNDFLVVHQGDEVDFHALGDWAHNPDGYSAGHELDLALRCMMQLYEMFPSCMVCTSNHTARPLRKAFAAGIPKAFLRDYHEFLKAPEGWKWSPGWSIDNIIFEHGENVSGQYAALNTAKQNMKSTSIGHQHVFGGVTWIGTPFGSIFGMNTGCLIDIEQYAFLYSAKARIKPTLGCGLILNGMPFFIPMFLDKCGRWTGFIP